MRIEARSFECGCLLAYRSTPDSPDDLVKFKNLIWQIKNGGKFFPGGEAKPILAAEYVIHLIKQLPAGHPLLSMFGNETAIIPVPGHLSAPSKESPMATFARFLVDAGLAGASQEVVKRKVDSPKSAKQPKGERYNYRQHLETFEARPLSGSFRSVLVVDDVISTSATIYATCLAVSDANPGIMVRAFGISRTNQAAEKGMLAKVGLLGPSGLNI